MHGLIHVIFKAFVLDKFGAGAWAQVLEKCGLKDDAGILNLKQYEDDITFGAITAAAEVAALPLDAALAAFGAYFVRHIASQGWAKMLRSMGRSLKEFLMHLNELHYFLERDFRSATFPCFKIEEEPEGQGLRMTYSSQRFLPALAMAVLLETALVLFGASLEVQELARTENSVTWRIIETGRAPAEAPADDAGAAATDGGAAATAAPQLGFQAFHEAIASLWRRAPFACCTPETGEEVVLSAAEIAQDEGVVAEANEAETRVAEANEEDWRDAEEAAPRRRSSRRLTASPSHGFALPEFEEGELAAASASSSAAPHDSSWSSGDLSPITAARSDHAMPFSRGITDWIRDIPQSSRQRLALQLMRAVPARCVCAGWAELDRFAESKGHFWGPGSGTMENYSWSAECFVGEGLLASGAPIRFVSHAWAPPEDWDALIGSGSPYEDIKAAALCMVVKDLAAERFGDAARWGEVRLWIDKCCIQQDHANPDRMRICIELIEEFVHLCDGLVVVFTWSYLSRLWCVYEWACFLVYHEPVEVLVGADCFYRASTEEHFLRAVRDFQVSACECTVASDRAILAQKIQEYYGSNESFERFLKFTVLALVGRCLVLRGARNAHGLERWVALAEDCGFRDLAASLAAADPVAWRRAASADRSLGAAEDWQTAVQNRCEDWFARRVVPLVERERLQCVRKEALARMIKKRSSVRSWYSSPRDWQSSPTAC